MNSISRTMALVVVIALVSAVISIQPAQAAIFTTLYSFCSQPGCTDGDGPEGGLVQATDGNFYGTTYEGGVNSYGLGTVYRITPGGTLTTLYSFCSVSSGGYCTDGDEPFGSLTQATDGDLYGTSHGGIHGDGTVFKITLSGTLTTLHAFTDKEDSPVGGLVQATDGNFYGTGNGIANSNEACEAGGQSGRCGSILRISPTGSVGMLYKFCSEINSAGYCADGFGPNPGLIQGIDGNFYGTTQWGGANNQGTVFTITPHGALTTLYSFCSQGTYPNCTDGENPQAGLVQAAAGDTHGDLWGTTSGGDGAGSGGTVFKVTRAER